MAPEVGFEPTTNRLTADRSTTELLRNFRAAEGWYECLTIHPPATLFSGKMRPPEGRRMGCFAEDQLRYCVEENGTIFLFLSKNSLYAASYSQKGSRIAGRHHPTSSHEKNRTPPQHN